MTLLDEQMEREAMARELLAENVDRGEIFLDSVDPEWYKKVQRPQLHMQESQYCICGWVFRDLSDQMGFHYFQEHYPEEEAEDLGFDYDPGVIHPKQWSILAELWIIKIEKRLANDGLLG